MVHKYYDTNNVYMFETCECKIRYTTTRGKK